MNKTTRPDHKRPTTKGIDMNYTKDIVNISTILEEMTAASPRFTIDFDEASSWIDIICFNSGSMTGLAVSRNTSQIYSFEITGSVVRSNVVRAAAYPMRNIELTSGELQADRETRVGATVNELFVLDSLKAELSI